MLHSHLHFSPKYKVIKGLINMQIKYAKKLLKNNLCAAILCVITPFIMYMIIKATEYAVRRYFYPHYQAAIREIIILLCIITLHFVLIYPLSIAKKLCFYNNCEQKSIPLCRNRPINNTARPGGFVFNNVIFVLNMFCIYCVFHVLE